MEELIKAKATVATFTKEEYAKHQLIRTQSIPGSEFPELRRKYFIKKYEYYVNLIKAYELIKGEETVIKSNGNTVIQATDIQGDLIIT